MPRDDSSFRARLLLSAFELHVIPAQVKPVLARSTACQHLQRGGAMQLRIIGRGGLNQIVSADILHNELRGICTLDDARSIRSGGQAVSVEAEWHLGNAILLILLLNSRRVAGIVHQADQNVEAVRESNPA